MKKRKIVFLVIVIIVLLAGIRNIIIFQTTSVIRSVKQIYYSYI